MNIPEDREYDWAEALHYLGDGLSVAEGSSASDSREMEIDQILALRFEDGDYAEVEVYAVLLLKDGRFAFHRAGCDTTGWDCQAGGWTQVSHSLQHLYQMSLGEDERADLFPNGLPADDA